MTIDQFCPKILIAEFYITQQQKRLKKSDKRVTNLQESVEYMIRYVFI